MVRSARASPSASSSRGLCRRGESELGSSIHVFRCADSDASTKRKKKVLKRKPKF